MKKTIIFLLLVYSFIIFAQNNEWQDACVPNMSYNQNEYFIGSARDVFRSNENISVIINRLKSDATDKLANSISSHIKSETVSILNSEKINKNEIVTEILRSKVITSVDIELVGLQYDTCTNPINNELTVYVYVKKSDFILKMRSVISNDIFQIEDELYKIEFLIENGHKSEVQKKSAEYQHKLDSLFTEIVKYQSILCRTDDNITQEQLQSDLNIISSLKKRYSNLLNEFTKGMNIYISCNPDIYGEENFFCSRLSAKLSEFSCTFVDTISQADIIIEIETKSNKSVFKLTEMANYQIKVLALIKIYNGKSKQKIHESIITSEEGQSQGLKQVPDENYAKAASIVYCGTYFYNKIINTLNKYIEL